MTADWEARRVKAQGDVNRLSAQLAQALALGSVRPSVALVRSSESIAAKLKQARDRLATAERRLREQEGRS